MLASVVYITEPSKPVGRTRSKVYVTRTGCEDVGAVWDTTIADPRITPSEILSNVTGDPLGRVSPSPIVVGPPLPSTIRLWLPPGLWTVPTNRPEMANPSSMERIERDSRI